MTTTNLRIITDLKSLEEKPPSKFVALSMAELLDSCPPVLKKFGGAGAWTPLENSPWTPEEEEECPRAKFEQASNAFNKAIRSLPSGTEMYTGRRKQNGMPDKRTREGKKWYQALQQQQVPLSK